MSGYLEVVSGFMWEMTSLWKENAMKTMLTGENVT